jgi:hypothetical protein
MPFTDHDTALFVLFETVAENFTLAPTRKSEVAGITVTLRVAAGFSGEVVAG